MLGAGGVAVPETVTTADGRDHSDGILVQRLIPGAPPAGDTDWQRVIAAIAVVHEMTVGWPQRPGFASAQELLQGDTGGDVDLAAMPPESARLVRDSWRPALGGCECVVHGDLGAGNVLVTDEQVALIDWDEARVDVPAFDFAHVPEHLAIPVGGNRRDIVTAGVAWEAATCWVAEPDYAAHRLTELRRRVNRPG